MVHHETASCLHSGPAPLLSGAHGSTTEGVGGHLVARPLLSPDEAMRLPAHLQVLRSGHALALVAKLRHFADREFAGLADP